MNAPILNQDFLKPAEAESALADLAKKLRGGAVIPYLGPALTAMSASSVPMTPETLADYFGTKVALPRRARGNVWAAAQYVEGQRHRSTVTNMMNEAFAPKVEPTPLHLYLASLPIPLIIDTWYDGAARLAFAGRSDWGEIQGITRAGIGESLWYRFYDAAGKEVDKSVAQAWTTILYKPHGAVAPAKNFLISDADYVEVLTEIDIQSPIPEAVTNIRTERTFLFIGCRFHDQMLRTYARQISKRSSGPHYALVDPEKLTLNERRFLATENIVPIAVPLLRASEILMAE
jgi:hypothetical protein